MLHRVHTTNKPNISIMLIYAVVAAAVAGGVADAYVINAVHVSDTNSVCHVYMRARESVCMVCITGLY